MERSLSQKNLGTRVVWQWIRAAIGITSVAIGVYQFLQGNGSGGAFSLCIAATFFVGIVLDNAVIRVREAGVTVPTSLIVLSSLLGASLGGTLVLGALMVMGIL
jgi:hypothetical protein